MRMPCSAVKEHLRCDASTAPKYSSAAATIRSDAEIADMFSAERWYRPLATAPQVLAATMSTNDDPSREVAPTFPATLSPPTQHSLGSHTPRTELEGALTQHEAEQGRSSPSQQLAKSLVSTQPPPIPEKQAPAMKEDTAGLQDGDEAFLVRFCQVYRSMGSVSEQKTWGSNNASVS
jgi:hypothetical protein